MQFTQAIKLEHVVQLINAEIDEQRTQKPPDMTYVLLLHDVQVVVFEHV
jgi:hypothetical protein